MPTPRFAYLRSEPVSRRVLRHQREALLTVIILFGALLRFAGLGKESLWGDELSTWLVSSLPSARDIITFVAAKEAHPPGYYLLIHMVERAFGTSEAVLRLPSAVAGLLCVPAIYLLGARLYGKSEALIAAGLIAVAPTAIYYSQEARSNAFLMLFPILTTYLWLFVVGFATTSPARTRLASVSFAAVSILLAFIHYYGTLFVALQALWSGIAALRNRGIRRRLIAIYGVLMIAFAPWLTALPGQLDVHGEYWLPQPTPLAFLDFLRFTFGYSSVLLLVSLSVLTLSLARSFARMVRSNALDHVHVSIFTAMLLVWFLSPFVAAYLISITVAPILLARSLIVSLPAAYLLLARATSKATANGLLRLALALVLMAIASRHLIIGMRYYSAAHKQQLREALTYIRTVRPQYPNSIIATYAQALDLAEFDYYLHPTRPSESVQLLAGRDDQIAQFAASVQDSHAQFVWYIKTWRSPDSGFLAYLNTDYCLLREESFIGVEVRLLQVGPCDAAPIRNSP
jgi:uncharacterized membrane protein